MKPIVIIPARGGSKGVPRKNSKLLNGKPLIHFTVNAAREVFEDHLIYVSTDDLEIKECVEKTGLKVPFLRPSYLATDTSGTYEVLLHAIEFAESSGYHPDIVIVLQPTSPFRTAQHIREALDLFNEQLEMVVSVKETKSNPYYVLFEEDETGLLRKSKASQFTRRQDCPKVWEVNGAIYLIKIDALKHKTIGEFTKTRKYVMDEISSHDIDTMLDWCVAEIYAKEMITTSHQN